MTAPESRVERRTLRRGLRSRRVAVLAAVGVLLVAAAAAGDRSAATGTGAGAGAGAAGPSGPEVPGARSMPSAWYCVAGTASPEGRSPETLVMANLGARPARVEVTVMPGGDARPVSVELSIAGRTQRRLAVADVAPVENPGVVVEAFGGPVVVEHRLAAGNDRATGPCARDAGTTWYTSGGTTVEGASLWLEVFNPFPDDALVDIALYTADGVKERDDLSGLSVPARSRITVPVHEKALDSDRVGAVVRARLGRVVVEQVLRTAAPYPRSGLTLSLGLEGPSTRWYLPAGSGGRDDSETLVVLNPSDTEVPVRITTHLDSGQFLQPDEVTVDGRSLALVDLRSRVPAGIGFWVTVDSRRPVVVESVLGRAGAAGTAGLAAMPGLARPADRWVVVGGRTREESGDRLSVANPGRRAVRLTLRVVGEGRSRLIGGSGRPLSVGPGRRVVVDLVAAKVPVAAAVVVEATGPVVVGHGAGTAPGVTRQGAVPFPPRPG